MTDIVLRDIDPLMAERIRRIAGARGWNIHDALFNLIEQGLFHCEAEVRSGFDSNEVDALTDAINALKEVPAGKGF